MSPDNNEAWTCPCGGTFSGNGGTSSHKRTCEVYHRTRRDSWARNLEAFKAEGRPNHEIRNAERLLAEHEAALTGIVGRQVTTAGDPANPKN